MMNLCRVDMVVKDQHIQKYTNTTIFVSVILRPLHLPPLAFSSLTWLVK